MNLSFSFSLPPEWRGCLFPAFHHFFISFREIQKLDGPKSEKLEASIHELLSFSLLGPSSFWIS
jgi:hypothetical protein